jgi:hypothetical protein
MPIWLNARAMLLRNYYELEEYDALFALLDSFEAYVRRQKGMGYHRSHYQALLLFTRRLLHLPEGDKDCRVQFKADIQVAPAKEECGWLLSKLYAIRSGHLLALTASTGNDKCRVVDPDIHRLGR